MKVPNTWDEAEKFLGHRSERYLNPPKGWLLSRGDENITIHHCGVKVITINRDNKARITNIAPYDTQRIANDFLLHRGYHIRPAGYSGHKVMDLLKQLSDDGKRPVQFMETDFTEGQWFPYRHIVYDKELGKFIETIIPQDVLS